ncbi:reverse transcriptase domain-containing protein [Streptomyces sp. 4N124]|uniref:reverse transcriptase domain-containing protein n=1 Tax=Streptomyces sp. 4N124 TaxID=3457420 RepID=UPI003FD6989C
MLKLIRVWLRMGTPQGSPISPLLGNIALHVLDEAWQHEGRRLGTLVRYCDDFVVLSPTRKRAEQARELAAKVLECLGMRLHLLPATLALGTSAAVLRDKVRAATACSKSTRPMSAVVADLNPVLRGWGAYFHNGNSGRKSGRRCMPVGERCRKAVCGRTVRRLTRRQIAPVGGRGSEGGDLGATRLT